MGTETKYIFIINHIITSYCVCPYTACCLNKPYTSNCQYYIPKFPPIKSQYMRYTRVYIHHSKLSFQVLFAIDHVR